MKSTRALQGKSAGKGKGRRNSCINILLKTNEKKRKTCIKYALILCLACFIPPKDVHGSSFNIVYTCTGKEIFAQSYNRNSRLT